MAGIERTVVGAVERVVLGALLEMEDHEREVLEHLLVVTQVMLERLELGVGEGLLASDHALAALLHHDLASLCDGAKASKRQYHDASSSGGSRTRHRTRP